MSHRPPNERGVLFSPGAVLLLSCYELGRQPLGIASPAALLEEAGFRPAMLDVSVDPIDPKLVTRARLIAIAVPMHTALRIGVAAGRKIRQINPDCHLAFYGLYAILNSEFLFAEGIADSVIGGEFEAPLLALAERLGSKGGNGRGVGAVEGVVFPGGPAAPHVARIRFRTPSREALPSLDRYAQLERDGERMAAASIEASRGCLHLCRHCPIPPVYGGRFFVVPHEVVVEDVDRLVAAGARHLTFGDPDFLNGPRHVMTLVREIHRRYPELSFDVTTKISNIIKKRELFPELRDCGCAFVVSAVESLSDTVLEHLDKGHDRADVSTALAVMRQAGIPLRPTFVPFTPWSTAEDYLDLLDFVETEHLIDHVDSVQFGLRLLLPPRSLLLQDPSLGPWLRGLDQSAFTYRWIHPDPRMDELHRQVSALVGEAAEDGRDPMATFFDVKELAHMMLGDGAFEVPAARPAFLPAGARHRPPRLTEDWFC